MSVSVIIPVYNGEATVEDAIRSALRCGADEVVIVDDGSYDNTLNICKHIALENVRVRVISQSNQGVGAARNTGIREARCEFIFFCDSDDVMLSIPHDKLSPEHDLIFSGAQIDTIHHNVCDETVIHRFPDREHRDMFKFYVEYDEKLMINSLWILFARREFLLDNELFFNEHIKVNEDVEFVTRAIASARCIRTVSNICYSYRRHIGTGAAFMYTNVTGQVINLQYHAISSFGADGEKYAMAKIIDRLYNIEISPKDKSYKVRLRHDMRDSGLLRSITPKETRLKTKKAFLMMKGY